MTNKTIGIICALTKEIIYYKETFKNLETKKIMNVTFYIAEYENNKVVFCECGIGKVNSGIVTVLMIEHFNPDFIINTGVAGAYDRSLKPFDVVVCDKAFYHDVDCRLDNEIPYGQIQGLPTFFLADIILNKYILQSNSNVYIGSIASGDEFVTDYDHMKNRLNTYFMDVNVLAVDMESASIAHACYLNNVPFTIIRAISDVVGGHQIEDYDKFAAEASKLAAKIVFNLIETEE